MKIKLHLNDVNDLLLEGNFPENYVDDTGLITERVVDMRNQIGNGLYKEIYFEGIRIAYGDLTLRESTVLQFESDFETVEMHFDLSGDSTTHLTGTSRAFTAFTHNTHNIIYAPGIKGRLHLSPTTRMVEINIVPSLFKRYLDDSTVFSGFLNDLKNQFPSSIGKHNMPITPDMMNLLNTILECGKTGMYKRMFLEAKVIELLMLQLEQFAAHDCRIFCSLKAADIDKMHHARQIIMEKLDTPCSLIDLARQIGTNEFTLKKGFKEVFGTTVFGMVADIKLMEAKEMLLSGEQNVSEASLHAGYKNSAHFSTAFKRKFGVSPSKYKIRR